MKKLQYWTLRVFLTCMFLCAGLFLFMIWRGGPDSFDIISKLTFTSFVFGLASFLIWITTVILEIKDRLMR